MFLEELSNLVSGILIDRPDDSTGGDHQYSRSLLYSFGLLRVQFRCLLVSSNLSSELLSALTIQSSRERLQKTAADCIGDFNTIDSESRFIATDHVSILL